MFLVFLFLYGKFPVHFFREISFNVDQKAFSEPQVIEPKNSVLKEMQGPSAGRQPESRVQMLQATQGVGPSPVPPELSIPLAGSLEGSCPAPDCGVPRPLDSQWQ